MNESQSPQVRKRSRWLIVAFVLVLVSVVSWWNWPRGDARFVGKWEAFDRLASKDGTSHTLERLPDGTWRSRYEPKRLADSITVFEEKGLVGFLLLPHLLLIQVAVPLAAWCMVAHGRKNAATWEDIQRFNWARLILIGSCVTYLISLAVVAEAGRAGMGGFATGGLAVLGMFLPSLALIVSTCIWAVLQLVFNAREAKSRPSQS